VLCHFAQGRGIRRLEGRGTGGRRGPGCRLVCLAVGRYWGFDCRLVSLWFPARSVGRGPFRRRRRRGGWFELVRVAGGGGRAPRYAGSRHGVARSAVVRVTPLPSESRHGVARSALVRVAGDRGIAPLPAGERHGVGRSALVWVAGGGGGVPLWAYLRCGGAGWFSLLQAVEGRGVGLLAAGWRHAGVGRFAIGRGPGVAILTTGRGARLAGRGRRVHPGTGGLGQAVSVGGRPLGRRLRIRRGRGPRRSSSLVLESRSGQIGAVGLDFGVERVAHPYSSSMFSSSAGSSGPTAPVHRTHSSPSGATWSKATAPSR
jgi:hypothetical protein